MTLSEASPNVPGKTYVGCDLIWFNLVLILLWKGLSFIYFLSLICFAPLGSHPILFLFNFLLI